MKLRWWVKGTLSTGAMPSLGSCFSQPSWAYSSEPVFGVPGSHPFVHPLFGELPTGSVEWGNDLQMETLIALYSPLIADAVRQNSQSKPRRPTPDVRPIEPLTQVRSQVIPWI